MSMKKKENLGYNKDNRFHAHRYELYFITRK